MNLLRGDAGGAHAEPGTGAGLTPWPAEEAQRYRREGYWQGRTLDDLAREQAARYGPRVALVEGARRWTYAELRARVERLAAGLHRRGIRPGERVVVQLPNVAEFVVVCLGLVRLGAAPVLALPAHRASEIEHLCRLSEAVAYVVPDVHAGFDHRDLAAGALRAAPSLREVLVAGEAGPYFPLAVAEEEGAADEAPPAPGDPGAAALFLLSGGTTGPPKLIPRTHDDYAYNVRRSAQVCGFGPDTVYLVALPAAHNFPLGCPGLLGTFEVGGRVVLAPSPAPPDAFPLIERERVTVTSLVPPLAMLWTEAARWAGRDLSSLRVLQVGGAPFPSEAARRVRPALGCDLQQVFGMAEGLLCYTAPDDDEEIVLATQGRPMSPADEIRVVGEDGLPVPAGGTGELYTRGPYTLRGYFRAAAYNRGAFTADGFYRTGDLVRMTPTGHLVVTGRVRDVINRGGEKISAEEVEDHLLAHAGVRDVAVISTPDPVLGERTCAVVVPGASAPAPGLADVVAFLRSRGLAEYKIPDRLEVVASLPGTGVGKVDKRALTRQVRVRIEAERQSRGSAGG